MTAEVPADLTSRRRPGRPRDAERERALLIAAVDVLAGRGYAALTVDEVASRAGASKATVYRRWVDKEALVVDALTRLADEAVPVPDTGSLREDLRAMLHGMTEGLSGPGGGVLRGLVGEVGRSSALTAAFTHRFVASRRAVLTEVLARADRRGELPPDARGIDLDLALRTGPALLVYEWLMTGVPVDRALADRIVDRLVGPLLDDTRSQQPTRR